MPVIRNALLGLAVTCMAPPYVLCAQAAFPANTGQ